jgi:hypothetical protein
MATVAITSDMLMKKVGEQAGQIAHLELVNLALNTALDEANKALEERDVAKAITEAKPQSISSKESK